MSQIAMFEDALMAIRFGFLGFTGKMRVEREERERFLVRIKVGVVVSVEAAKEYKKLASDTKRVLAISPSPAVVLAGTIT